PIHLRSLSALGPVVSGACTRLGRRLQGAAVLGSNWKGTGFTMRNNVYYDRRGPDITFAGKSFSEWKALPQDQGSLNADPLFVSPDNYNFRLRPESPALKMG